MNYDRAQADLVIAAEKPHEYGLRSRPISGEICQLLLADFLRREFHHLSFDSGQISKNNGGKPVESKYFSPQCDIIIYHGPASYERFGYVVVPLKQVILSIEVKKWVEKGHKSDQTARLQKFTGKPVFLVGFRHHSDYSELTTRLGKTQTFLFSKTTPGKYPSQVENFSTEYIHKGELERLVKELEKLA